MADDGFSGRKVALSDPALRAVDVTPSDSAELPHVSRAIYVGADGDIRVHMAGGGDPVTFQNVVAGMVYPIRARAVLATGTTAGAIIAIW